MPPVTRPRSGFSASPGAAEPAMPGRADVQDAGGVRGALRGLLGVVRQIVGAPDYQRYLDHHAASHPGTPPLTPREHYAEFVTRRFGGGATRCC